MAFDGTSAFYDYGSLQRIRVSITIRFTRLFLAGNDLRFCNYDPGVFDRRSNAIRTFGIGHAFITLSADPSNGLSGRAGPSGMSFRFTMGASRDVVNFRVALTNVFVLPAMGSLLNVFVR